jgi:hypothetical protein
MTLYLIIYLTRQKDAAKRAASFFKMVSNGQVASLLK